MLKEKLRKDFVIAAQNCWSKPNGAYTGEISADMLQDMGIPWVMVGHSERRSQCFENDEVVAEKANYALSKGLKVILCVGENLDIRMAQTQVAYVSNQLTIVADKIPRDSWKHMIITYEPLWAVGPDALKVASPVQTQDMHVAIRQWVAKTAGDDAAKSIRIIYGGSVNKGNCEKMAKQKDIDGFMLGSASLRPTEFCDIINSRCGCPLFCCLCFESSCLLFLPLQLPHNSSSFVFPSFLPVQLSNSVRQSWRKPCAGLRLATVSVPPHAQRSAHAHGCMRTPALHGLAAARRLKLGHSCCLVITRRSAARAGRGCRFWGVVAGPA